MLTDAPFESMSDMKRFSFLLNDYSIERKQSRSDVEFINTINQLPIREIAGKLGKSEDLFDDALNMHPKLGLPYEYILQQFRLPSEAKKWINETYGMKLTEFVDLSKYRGMGEKILE